MSQIMEVKMCDSTPTSMSMLDSGSSQQFPNPKGETSIKEPLSPLNEGSVLYGTLTTQWARNPEKLAKYEIHLQY